MIVARKWRCYPFLATIMVPAGGAAVSIVISVVCPSAAMASTSAVVIRSMARQRGDGGPLPAGSCSV
jgi:hypothetical protein